MDTDHVFIAARPLAQHCPELLRIGPDPADLLPQLGRMGERLARRLAGALAPLLGGEAPAVRCLPPQTGTIATIGKAAAQPLAANSLFGIGLGMTPLLVAMSAGPVFRIVDRAYGGNGAAPDPLPESFPMAADLMIARLEVMIAAHITGAIAAVAAGAPGVGGASAAAEITPQRRDGSLASLAPFPESQSLAILTLAIEEADLPPWHLTLALAVAALPALFGSAQNPGQTGAAPPRRAATSLGEPLAEVPLTLSALIVDMLLPFITVAALTPGQVLPVTVARSIPLRAGGITVAHGTIGAVDDNVAIQITSAFTR